MTEEAADPSEPGTLAHHLGHLQLDADNLVTMLESNHAEGGDVHPEALASAARLRAGLHDVINALTTHEHLAMDTDDVWSFLTRKHRDHDSGYS